MIFTVHSSPFTVCYPFSVFRGQWLMVNGKCMEIGKRQMVNGASEGSVL
ncbi:MAG: hypothetical protein UX30_C0001G0028 [Candidatus Saccharibacteria bacterium GW2011_GWA2_46_10]|nr:MAG: hypothetical protein UX30_C0001G0028 [Candidatus Saccharibacteria bacterium GW2011_GWA2_46_10]